MTFLNANDKLYERQFGFRHNHLTTHALSAITEKIRQACDSGNFACGVFLDLQKAFDTVNHDILLKKLEHYGIRGITNSCFQSYLNDRIQFTTVNKCQSSKKYLNQILMYGVLQGSVLGPLLFILFINDLHKSAEFRSVHHFTDNTNLILTDKLIKKIN